MGVFPWIGLFLASSCIDHNTKLRRLWKRTRQAPFVERADNAIHQINHYKADSVVCFVNIYLLDSDLSGG